MVLPCALNAMLPSMLSVVLCKLFPLLVLCGPPPFIDVRAGAGAPGRDSPAWRRRRLASSKSRLFFDFFLVTGCGCGCGCGCDCCCDCDRDCGCLAWGCLAWGCLAPPGPPPLVVEGWRSMLLGLSRLNSSSSGGCCCCCCGCCGGCCRRCGCGWRPPVLTALPLPPAPAPPPPAGPAFAPGPRRACLEGPPPGLALA